MLTKQERAVIAERLRKPTYIIADDLYEAIIGEEIPDDTSIKEDSEVIKTRLIELCDTSNMIELPLDKDGEVIKVGDTVYVDDDVKYKVVGYMMRGNSTEVILAAGTEPVYTKEPANNITHKKPVTIESLVERFEYVLAKGQMSYWAVGEICDIVDQLKKLGDSDD